MTRDLVVEILDALAPPQRFVPDWEEVLRRTGNGRAFRDQRERKRMPRRRMALAIVVVIAVFVPLGTLGATDSFWFLRFPISGETSSPTSSIASPEPGTTTPKGPLGVAPAVSPVAVKTGTWEGHGWELDAFVGAGGDLCFGVAPTATIHGGGADAALSCARIYGVPTQTPSTQGPLPLDITYLMNGRTNDLPPYIAGPVVGTASNVVIYFADGEVVRTPTFEAPPSLGSVRFYASPIPDAVATAYLQAPPGPGPALNKIVGLDENDNIVACLRMPMMEGGVPLAACR
jgi:hypothetical protein